MEDLNYQYNLTLSPDPYLGVQYSDKTWVDYNKSTYSAQRQIIIETFEKTLKLFTKDIGPFYYKLHFELNKNKLIHAHGYLRTKIPLTYNKIMEQFILICGRSLQSRFRKKQPDPSIACKIYINNNDWKSEGSYKTYEDYCNKQNDLPPYENGTVAQKTKIKYIPLSQRYKIKLNSHQKNPLPLESLLQIKLTKITITDNDLDL